MASGDDLRGNDGRDHARQRPADASPMGFPSPESNPEHSETRTNPCPKRESKPPEPESASGEPQSPFTRSSTSQITEKPHKSANQQADSHACGPTVSYLGARKSNPTPSNRSKNRAQDCSTRSSHQPSARGLWLRRSIYQFRVKVPVDLREVIGKNPFGGKNAGSPTDRWH